MPTMIAKLGREKSIATLAKRIYAIEGDDAALKQRQAEEALLTANPRLSVREGFRTGSAIRVPRLEGLKIKDIVDEAKPDGEGVIAESNLRLQLLASRIEDSFQKSLKRQEQAMANLSNDEFRALAAKALPESRELLASAAEVIKEQSGKDREEANRFEAILNQAQDSLAALQVLGNRLPRR